MPKVKKASVRKTAKRATKAKRVKNAPRPNANQKAAKASHELLLDSVNSVRDYAIFVLDPEGNVLTWNEGAQRLKGYRPAEIIGRNFTTFYTEADLARAHPAYELKEAKKHGRYEEEGWRVRKDGTQFWANIVITKITDKEGNLIGFSKVTRDLTERRRAEEALRQAYADLDLRVQERTKELAVSNARLAQREQELERAVQMRDDFLSIASHELKTPVTSLKMQMQMLRERTKPEQGLMPPPERIVRAVESSLRQIDRLALLIEDLLDVARASAKKLDFRLERAELRPLLEETVARHADHAHAAGCTVELHAEAGICAQVDKFRFEQVLVNLLTNAFKYAPGTRVEVGLTASGGMARVTVRDHGPGIPPELRDKVFERFERAHNARNISGLGLGLYISREIVRGHQGDIHVSSVPGQGATFVVELPACPREAAAGASP